MLGVMHVIPAGPKRQYVNLVYVFEGSLPHRILAVAEEPLKLPLGSVGHGFVFTSSLFRLDERAVESAVPI